jgi:hypothetical protein
VDDNAVIEVIEERPLAAEARAAGVVRDAVVRLGSKKTLGDLRAPVRLAEVACTPHRKPLSLPTFCGSVVVLPKAVARGFIPRAILTRGTMPRATTRKTGFRFPGLPARGGFPAGPSRGMPRLCCGKTRDDHTGCEKFHESGFAKRGLTFASHLAGDLAPASLRLGRRALPLQRRASGGVTLAHRRLSIIDLSDSGL